jgi:hypothetical protein
MCCSRWIKLQIILRFLYNYQNTVTLWEKKKIFITISSKVVCFSDHHIIMHYHYTAITFEGWQQLFWETSDRVFCHREVNQYNALLCFTSFRIRDSLQFKCIHITITKHKITIPKFSKITFLIPIPHHPSPSLSFTSSSISLSFFLSPFRLHSVFLSVPFPPSLSHFTTFFPHLLDCLSASSFLSFHPIPVFSLLILTSESCHASHTPCCIWILWFSPFFLACPCLCPFHSALHSSILPSALNVSISSLAYPFL